MNQATQLKEVPIFFACDDAYIPYFAVALESLEANATKNYQYMIKVMHANGISAESQAKIKQRYHHDNFNIEFVDITDVIRKHSNKFFTRDYYSKATYFRLFIPNMYPQYDKVLYLDSDIVILDDIANLYNTDLGNNLVGAVTDESVQLVPEFQEYVVNRIKVKSPKHYFNAGILLMNLRRLREIDFENMFLNLIGNVTFDVAQDQDYLNVICHGQVKYLSGAWDKMPFPNPNGVKEKDIKLIHYNHDQKPWVHDDVLYADYFWQYARATDFYDVICQRKAAYTAEQRRVAAEQIVNLIAKAHTQAVNAVENRSITQIINEVCAFDLTDVGVVCAWKSMLKMSKKMLPN